VAASTDRTLVAAATESGKIQRDAAISRDEVIEFLIEFIDDQANAWPCSVFTQKQVFGPHTAKSQPILIKFCTHLLLYGIHMWADLNRDLRVGDSRPNQNDYVFCNTCNTPQVLYRDDRSPRFRRQTVKVDVRTGAIVKNSGILHTPTGNSFTQNQ